MNIQDCHLNRLCLSRVQHFRSTSYGVTSRMEPAAAAADLPPGRASPRQGCARMACAALLASTVLGNAKKAEGPPHWVPAPPSMKNISKPAAPQKMCSDKQNYVSELRASETPLRCWITAGIVQWPEAQSKIPEHDPSQTDLCVKQSGEGIFV